MTRRLVITFGIFVMLGLPEGVLGTAWPSMRLELGRPESNLSALLAAYIVAYMFATVGTGRLADRLGADRLTRVGMVLTATGLSLYVIAPLWLVAIAAAFVLGYGAGLIDATVNAEVALRYGPRVMHLLHASFGVGAMLGPLLVVAVLGLDQSFRLAWGVLAAIEILLLIGFVTSTRAGGHALDDENAEVTGTSARPGLVLAATLAYFAFYVSAETSLGQWSYSVLTEDRSVGEGVAGLAVSSYWGGLTVGRFLLAGIGERLPPLVLLRTAMVVSLAGIAWFALDVGPSILALPIVGLAFAGVFPSLVLCTPGWIGSDRVGHAVGYQLAASSAGAATTALVFFVLVRNFGLDIVPVAIAVIVAAMVAIHAVTEWAARPAG